MSEFERLVKLVRDLIPEKVTARGVVYKAMPPEDHQRMLRRKLVEEAIEYLEEPSVEELCDVLEVVEALAVIGHGITLNGLEFVRDDKHTERGGFVDGIGMYVTGSQLLRKRP